MDRYALDANAVAEDLRFSRNPARLLLREARLNRVGLLVPEVAFDEVVNLFRERVAHQVGDWRRAGRKLKALGALEEELKPHVAPESAADSYSASLRQTLVANQAVFLPYPDVTHEAVVARALSRSPPFDSEGENGYRDALIWESIMQAVDPENPIVLVTGDKAAFGSKSGQLRPELVDELVQRGFDPQSVRRLQRVADFTGTLPRIRAAEVAIEAQLNSDGDTRNIVVGTIEEEAFDYGESKTSVIGLGLEVEQLYFKSVDHVGHIDVIAARALDDELAVELRADVTATLEVHISKADAYAYEGDDLQITNYDNEDSLAEGVVRRLVWTELYATWTSDASEFRGAQVYNFLPMGSVD